MHPKAYARVLFMDFSSAFNSMKTHILLKRLCDLNTDSGLILCIRYFLFCRPQRICVRRSTSVVVNVSTGCPQGCVPSPVLFSLFRNDFMINDPNFKLFNYTDIMALIGLFQKLDATDIAAYLDHIQSLQTWCCTSQLEINVDKRNELMICTKQDENMVPVSLHLLKLWDILNTLAQF